MEQLPTALECLLVHTGATCHIVSDKDKFNIFYDDIFVPSEHYIELADNSKSNGVLNARGNATIDVHDNNGVKYNVILQNSLHKS